MLKRYIAALLTALLLMGGVAAPVRAEALPGAEPTEDAGAFLTAMEEAPEPESAAALTEAPETEAEAASTPEPVAEAETGAEPEPDAADESTSPVEPQPEEPAAEPDAPEAEALAVESIAVEGLTLGVKQSAPLAVTVLPEGAACALTYKSSSTRVATVSKDGVVTAKAAGTATITVTTDNGKKATCKVTVKYAPSWWMNCAENIDCGEISSYCPRRSACLKPSHVRG